jgi:hypothetical protein
MILLQSFLQLLQAGSHRRALFREVNWCLWRFCTAAIISTILARQGNPNPRALSLTARTNDNVVTIGIARIARSSVPFAVSNRHPSRHPSLPSVENASPSQALSISLKTYELVSVTMQDSKLKLGDLRASHTLGAAGGLANLTIETRLINERFASVMGACLI